MDFHIDIGEDFEIDIDVRTLDLEGILFDPLDADQRETYLELRHEEF